MNSPDDKTPRPESTPAVEPPLQDVESPEPCLRRRSRRGFATAGAAVLTGLLGWRWLVTRSEQEGRGWPLRRVLEFNERVANAAFRASRTAPEFPRTLAREPRVNGRIG